MPKSHMNGHASSQESRFFSSPIAAAQDKVQPRGNFLSRKRTADGAVKDTNVSPVRGGHSRNTSAVSMASSDLKTRLSYAMVKLNHGWQSHSIDEPSNRHAGCSPKWSPQRDDEQLQPEPGDIRYVLEDARSLYRVVVITLRRRQASHSQF
ncbi:hypothetical protein EV126DRAFT_489732 [Verticillium dahliae]|nr:hypothetical protein EV126DRAFT_489732 [Verticillium dahliae]